MISLLTPSRGRLWSLERFVSSVIEVTADLANVEIIVMDDNEDGAYDNWDYPSIVKLYKVAPRPKLSELWNIACQKATGPIYMLADDELVFQTPGWDRLVEAAFDRYPDKILLVQVEDGDEPKSQYPSPIIHRNWVEAVGYFSPPYFSGDFPDTWLTELAEGVNRKVKLAVYCEHMHPAFKKGPLDLTHAERIVSHFKDNMPQLYLDTLPERQAAIAKLARYIKEYHA